VHIGVDHLLQSSLSPSFGKSPPESLQCRADLQSLIRAQQKVFDIIIIEQSQWLLWVWLVLLLAVRVMATFLEPVLKLLLDGHHLIVKRVVVPVVEACIVGDTWARGLPTAYVDLVLLHLLLLLDY
jgi:hypothetical protein